MRFKLITLIALPVVLAIGLSGCAAEKPTPPRVSKPMSSATPTPEKPADPDGLGDPKDRTGAIGTRGNPAPAGTVLPIGAPGALISYTVTIGEITFPTHAEIEAKVGKTVGGQAGHQFIVFPVTYTIAGATENRNGAGTPAKDTSIEFVNVNGRVSDRWKLPFFYPGSMLEHDEFMNGPVGPYPMSIEVPSEDLRKGLLAISLSSDGPKKRFYIKLA